MWHRKPGGGPVLSQDLISESWTLPFLHCKLLWMALWEYLVALVRTTMSEAWRLQEVKGRLLTSGRLLKQWLLQFKAYLAAPNPPWEVNLSQEYLDRTKKAWSYQGGLTPTKWHCSPKKPWRVSTLVVFYLFQSQKRLNSVDTLLPRSALTTDHRP